MFSAVDVIGWQGLYLFGLGPLVLLSWMRRRMPETTRFEAQKAVRESGTTLENIVRPVLDLLQMYPARFAIVSSVVFLLSFAEYSATFFAPKYFQDHLGWSPGQFAFMGFFGGFLGIFGSAFAGRTGALAAWQSPR